MEHLYFQMLDLLFDFVDLSMTKLCPEKGKMEELEEYYMVCKKHGDIGALSHYTRLYSF